MIRTIAMRVGSARIRLKVFDAWETATTERASFLVPVDGGAASDGFDELLCDLFEHVVSEFHHGGVVLAYGVVEGEFVVS
jgi:hypothetical protein